MEHSGPDEQQSGDSSRCRCVGEIGAEDKEPHALDDGVGKPPHQCPSAGPIIDKREDPFVPCDQRTKSEIRSNKNGVYTYHECGPECWSHNNKPTAHLYAPKPNPLTPTDVSNHTRRTMIAAERFGDERRGAEALRGRLAHVFDGPALRVPRPRSRTPSKIVTIDATWASAKGTRRPSIGCLARPQQRPSGSPLNTAAH